MYAQNFNQPARLPVPFNGVDQGTLSNQLPQGNDRIPQVQLSQWMNVNQQIGLLAIGTLRMNAQNSLQRSGTHCAAYNLISQNGFNNQLWVEYCQMAIDFTEFLCVVKRYQPQDATKMAGQRVYEALLAMVFSTYAAELQNEQVTSSSFWGGLQTAAQIHAQVTKDIRDYKAGAYNQQNNFQNFGNSGQLPPIGQHNLQQSNNNNGISNFQTSGYQPNGGNGGYHIPAESGHGSSVGNSLYDDPTPPRVLKPVEEISSDTDYYGNSIPQENYQMNGFTQANQQQQQFVEPEVSDLPIPKNVEEVVVDPTYYAPAGIKLDLKRPYDTVFNPGGIVIRPAHQVQWEVTFGDDTPWLQQTDPNRFCEFLVKFPDGTIKEKFVEWNPSMQYLRHELDAELIRKAYRPSGEVVPNQVPMSTIGGDAMAEETVGLLIKDGHLKRALVPPVLLEKTFTGTNDMDIELQVTEELTNLLTVNFNKDIPQPAAEYRSTYLHPIVMEDDAFNQLEMLAKQEELGQVALGLRELVAQGVLTTRYYNFINERLTKATNDVLTDALALTSTITDFCEDYVALEEYLTQKKGEAMVKVLRGAAKSILNKSLCLMELRPEDEREASNYYVADNYLNFQLGFTLDQLSTLNIRQGKAVLVSASAHPTILESLRGMISRANANEEFIVGTMRLITADGHYLEVIRGRLVAKAVLLKMVK